MNENEKNVVVLIDYENIVHEATDMGMVVDFEGLAALRRTFGNVVVSMVFAPQRQIEQEPWLVNTAWENGFYTTPVPSPLLHRDKYYRTADAMMSDYGVRMCSLPCIDAIVIISHDGDFTPLANLARDAGKQVILVAGGQVSRALVKAVDIQVPLPMKK